MTPARRRFLSHLSLAPALLLGGTPALAKNGSGEALTVGLMPYLSTRTLLHTHEALAHSLEQTLQRPVQLRTATDYQDFFQHLRNGSYDLVISPPHYAWLAISDYGYQPLLVHKEPIRGVIVSASNKPLHSSRDLRGGSIAINDRSALLAIIGSQVLAAEGLQEGRDYHFINTVSHSSALQNAVIGKTRAALVNATSLRLAPPDIRERTLVWREIAVIPGQFYIARPGLAAATVDAVRKALLVFEASAAGREFFSSTGQGGYRPVNADDRALLERALPETRRLLHAATPG